MAVTQNTHVGDGSTVLFSFTFEYIKEADVQVSVDGELQETTEYSFATATSIEFNTAPSDGAAVRIYRLTDVDEIRATFFAGSAIRAQDLNNNSEQLLFSIQERDNQFVPKENAEFVNDVDFNDNKLIQVADPTEAQDAATKNYVDSQTWSDTDETIHSDEAWQSVDTQIATTEAIDQRIDSKIDDALTVDIDGTDGISVTDDSPSNGQITIGLNDNEVDFSKIKDDDKIKLDDQESDPDVVGTDNNIFTAQAATRRFNNYYQNSEPSTTDGIGVGQVWVDPDDDLTLSVWTGSNWSAITSGGTFTNQPKVIYVDAGSGDDDNDGHRISRPKKTIEAALSDINDDDTNGDGSIISLAPGIYAETLPLDIERNDVGIIGQSLRTCIIHPKIPTADTSTYDVDTPHSQELETMFRVNSGSYFKNLTLMGLKASGTRGDTGSLYTDSTHGLPPNQGWNFGFFPDADIKKSPYIQNCTNFSDSQINNVTLTPHTPGEGAAGDLDSAPTGGGILVDGSVPHVDSPLRSIVCDSYTHTALDGPGIFVTNNGYAQCTSSYAFFNHAHITCVNGGQANLAASTSDFGRFGLIADGKSPSAIFTSNVDGAATDGDTTFNINAPTAATDWFGSATRPQNNMLVEVNSVIYPVLSATANTDTEGNDGWTVTISRPDPEDASENLGIDGDIDDDASVEFFLRSMIASSGHTMEYVGSGTNYTALPENGGVPIESNQVVERNDGKVWSATTDHKGKFKLGDFFTVDQQTGSFTINDGSFKVNLETLDVNTDGDAVFGANLDMGDNQITSTTGDLKLAADGDINAQTHKIINVVDPTSAQDVATKNYVDTNGIDSLADDASPQLGGNLDVNGHEIVSVSNGDITINPDGTGDIVLDADVGIGASAPDQRLHVASGASTYVQVENTGDSVNAYYGVDTGGAWVGASTNHPLKLHTNNTERFRIDGSGRLLVGTTTARGNFLNSTFDAKLQVEGADQATSTISSVANSASDNPMLLFGRSRGTSLGSNTVVQSGDNLGQLIFQGSDGTQFVQAAAVTGECDGTPGADDMPGRLVFSTTANGAATLSERLRIDSSGRVGIGTTSPSMQDGNDNPVVHLYADSSPVEFRAQRNDGADAFFTARSQELQIGTNTDHRIEFRTNDSERVRITSGGLVGIGVTSPTNTLHVVDSNGTDGSIDFGPTANRGRLYASSDGIFFGSTSNHSVILRTNGTERARINTDGRFLINTTISNTLNGVSSHNNLVVAGSTSDTDITDNSSAAITISNKDGTADNTAGLHFAREDTDEDPHYAGASVVAQFRDTQVTGEYPRADLAFLTSTAANNAPSEKMRLLASGTLLVGSTSSSSTSEDIEDSKGGIRAIPQRNTSSAYTLVAGDVGRHVNVTNSSAVTVPSGVFSAGDAVTIYNNSTSNLTITQGSSVTLRLVATNTSGNRTLAQHGLCTILCIADNVFVASGGGLT